MRPVLGAAQALRQQRPVRIVEVPMVYINCVDRDTGNKVGVGFWKGKDTNTMAVRDMYNNVRYDRTFYHGALIEVVDVRAYIGFDVRPSTLVLGGRHPATLLAFFEREARGAEVCAYKRIYHPDTMKPIGIDDWFKARVSTAPLDRPEPGGETTLTVSLMPPSRSLTFPSNYTKSDQQMMKRNGDRIRRYKMNNEEWEVPWGTEGRD